MHTADIALKVFSSDLAGLFEGAAMGMTALMGANCGADVAPTTVSLALESHSVETLLVDWLSEILFLSDTRQGALCDLAVSGFSESTIMATLTFTSPCQFDRTIKAVTYHDLAIRQGEAGYETQIVFDI